VLGQQPPVVRLRKREDAINVNNTGGNTFPDVPKKQIGTVSLSRTIE
jgi:hypothetical protein